MIPHYSWPETATSLQFGGGPSQSKTAKENERLNNQLLKQQLAQMSKSQPEAAPITIPKPPVYAPPPTQTSMDAEAAAQEFRRNMRRRRGFLASKLTQGTGAAGGTGAPGLPTSPAPTPVSTGGNPTLG